MAIGWRFRTISVGFLVLGYLAGCPSTSRRNPRADADQSGRRHSSENDASPQVDDGGVEDSGPSLIDDVGGDGMPEEAGVTEAEPTTHPQLQKRLGCFAESESGVALCGSKSSSGRQRWRFVGHYGALQDYELEAVTEEEPCLEVTYRPRLFTTPPLPEVFHDRPPLMLSAASDGTYQSPGGTCRLTPEPVELRCGGRRWTDPQEDLWRVFRVEWLERSKAFVVMSGSSFNPSFQVFRFGKGMRPRAPISPLVEVQWLESRPLPRDFQAFDCADGCVDPATKLCKRRCLDCGFDPDHPDRPVRLNPDCPSAEVDLDDDGDLDLLLGYVEHPLGNADQMGLGQINPPMSSVLVFSNDGTKLRSTGVLEEIPSGMLEALGVSQTKTGGAQDICIRLRDLDHRNATKRRMTVCFRRTKRFSSYSGKVLWEPQPAFVKRFCLAEDSWRLTSETVDEAL